jgi:hypothetical protein
MEKKMKKFFTILTISLLSYSAAAQEGTSTETLPKPEFKPKFTFELTSIMDASAKKAVVDNEQKITSYGAIGYKFDEVNRLSLRQAFKYTKIAFDDQKSVQTSASTLNPMLIYGRTLKPINGSNNPDFQLRMTLPAQDKSNYDLANIQPMIDIIWDVNTKVQVEYTLKPSFSLNSKSEKNITSLGANNICSYYNFSDYFAIYQSLGLISGNLAASGTSYFESGILVMPKKGVVLSLNLQQERSHVADSKFELYKDQESTYEALVQLLF